jgi:2,5-diamino-6-(ribosylamino)-4(3H)-pyrimidinone 5'-phosphate reductase
LTEEIIRLYPLPAQALAAGGIYEDLELPPPGQRDPSRPYVIMNMVITLDGRTAVEGRSSRIGSSTDRQTMRTLRSKADAVMIGAGTLRAEKLSLGLDDPAGRHPLALIVTNSGNIPLESNLIVPEGQEIMVITRKGATFSYGDQRVLCVSADTDGNLDLREALEVLKSQMTVGLLLVEGGPRLNYSLISQNLADELFLTLAPKLLGGPVAESRAILNGPYLPPQDVSLLSAHLAGEELFLRYDLRPPHAHGNRAQDA